MSKVPNAQYNLAKPDSMAVRVATRVRGEMFEMFMREFSPSMDDKVLDLGVTSDQSYSSSNYFEALYPYKDQITAAGIDDASFLERVYPGVQFVKADAMALPFENGSFDFVHSSAVLEHVGSAENQQRLIAESLRVARKGVFITTPNRWFPIEFHTQLPLVHWLPKPWFRALLRGLGQVELAQEANLNLISENEFRAMTKAFPDWSFRFVCARLMGWKSNLILVGRRT